MRKEGPRKVQNACSVVKYQKDLCRERYLSTQSRSKKVKKEEKKKGDSLENDAPDFVLSGLLWSEYLLNKGIQSEFYIP